ncbi:hypothetical protein HHI36_019123 [Cryptolaemus montrouzieri]|uniref:Uncharacterized protein n=1 Tax=Cryptolaemus montrouzieri TaxID=559131 RepID=A0ABD2P2R2_9CUCU
MVVGRLLEVCQEKYPTTTEDDVKRGYIRYVYKLHLNFAEKVAKNHIVRLRQLFVDEISVLNISYFTMKRCRGVSNTSPLILRKFVWNLDSRLKSRSRLRYP